MILRKEAFKNILRKGENAGNQHFLVTSIFSFPQNVFYSGLKNSDKSSWVPDFLAFIIVQNTFRLVYTLYCHLLYRVMCYRDMGRLQKDFKAPIAAN